MCKSERKCDIIINCNTAIDGRFNIKENSTKNVNKWLETMLGCFCISSWWLNINYVCTICVCHTYLCKYLHAIHKICFVHTSTHIGMQNSKRKRLKQTKKNRQKDIEKYNVRIGVNQKRKYFAKWFFFYLEALIPCSVAQRSTAQLRLQVYDRFRMECCKRNS